MDIAKTIALTAVGGLVVGVAACGSSETKDAASPGASGDTASPGTSGAAAPSASDSGAKTCCKTMNDCKHKGGCKTDTNACRGQNDCKHKGGCKHHKDDASCP